jgi:hypothetical protein
MKYVIVVISICVTLIVYANMNLKEPNIMLKSTTNRDTLLNQLFPKIKVQTLSKNKIELPEFTLGKPTIICIVFEQSAQALVDTWTQPVLEKYKNGEVNYFEIPMISSGYKWMSGFIDGGMRSGVPKNLHNNVATYYGKLNQYKNDLMLYNNKSCYLFLLDNTGHIKFLDEGASSTIKLNQLFMQIENL